MIDFTITQKVLEGCLLGDGHLSVPGIHPVFSYLSSSKQHAEFVHSFFKEYCSDNYQEVKRSEYFDNRTNKTYVRYSFRTRANKIFDDIYKKFYVNKLKIVPTDLEINKLMLLFWYIGDGELESSNGYIKLHTNCFSKDEVLFLCDKLKCFNSKILRKEKSKEEYLVTIPRNRVKLFLSFIGDCPFSDYSHKWKFVEYKNKNIEKNGIHFYSDIYPGIKEDFQTGNYTIYELHKKYNVPIKGIKNYFDVNNIIWKPISIKKEIVQYTLNGSIIQEWESAQEIKRRLGFNPSAISQCCRHIRKHYKNFIWEFKN